MEEKDFKILSKESYFKSVPLLDSDADMLKIFPIDRIGHFIIPSISYINLKRTNVLSTLFKSKPKSFEVRLIAQP